MIKREWSELRSTFRQIVETLHRPGTDLKNWDYELFVRLAYLAGDEQGREWLEVALRRVREVRPNNRVGCLVAVLAYTLCEMETGRYPKPDDAKAEARHRLGEMLRTIDVPPRTRRQRTEPESQPEHMPSPEEREATREYLRMHGPARHRRRSTGDEANE